MYKFKCPVCEKFELETFEECPYCHWEPDGLESVTPEDEPTGGPMGNRSVAEAKRLLAQGLDAWGDPLEEK